MDFLELEALRSRRDERCGRPPRTPPPRVRVDTRTGTEYLVPIGMLANACLEGTGRAGSELGYHVTLVRHATAAFSSGAMHAAHDVNGPTYAHAILTTEQLLAGLRGTSTNR